MCSFMRRRQFRLTMAHAPSMARRCCSSARKSSSAPSWGPCSRAPARRSEPLRLPLAPRSEGRLALGHSPYGQTRREPGPAGRGRCQRQRRHLNFKSFRLLLLCATCVHMGSYIPVRTRPPRTSMSDVRGVHEPECGARIYRAPHALQLAQSALPDGAAAQSRVPSPAESRATPLTTAPVKLQKDVWTRAPSDPHAQRPKKRA
jgi:hypothetical protein